MENSNEFWSYDVIVLNERYFWYNINLNRCFSPEKYQTCTQAAASFKDKGFKDKGFGGNIGLSPERKKGIIQIASSLIRNPQPLFDVEWERHYFEQKVFDESIKENRFPIGTDTSARNEYKERYVEERHERMRSRDTLAHDEYEDRCEEKRERMRRRGIFVLDEYE